VLSVIEIMTGLEGFTVKRSSSSERESVLNRLKSCEIV